MNPFFGSALSLRRRSVWEAVDSGVLLWRSGFVYFIPFFAIPVWVSACCLRLLPGNYYYLCYLVLWWLKPLFDRLVLHVVSRRFFDSQAASWLGELRSFLRSGCFRFLLGDLLWRRLSPGRAARMPIRVLERIRGEQFSQRKKALVPGGLNFCSLISLVCLALELMLLLGEIVFVVLITQMFFPSAFSYIRDNLETVEIFIFAAYCFNYIIVESLYVCMGFGLYINSRVEVEGWDLQLLFQKFAGPAVKLPAGRSEANVRQDSKPDMRIRAALLVFFFLALLFGPLSQTAHAESAGTESAGAESVDTDAVETDATDMEAVDTDAVETESVETDAADMESVDTEAVDTDTAEHTAPIAPVEYFPAEFPCASEASLDTLNGILASKDFGSSKEGWGIQFRDFDENDTLPDLDLEPWLEKIRRILGFMLRLVLVLSIAAFLGFAFYWLRKHYWNSFRRRGAFRGGGKSYNSPLLSAESPESLFARAEDLFKQGRLREAWAACLSGSVAAYSKYRSLSFPADATEYGCLELVRAAMPDESGGFGELVHNWVLFAYGGVPPSAGAFEKALASGRSLGAVSSGDDVSEVGVSGGAVSEGDDVSGGAV